MGRLLYGWIVFAFIYIVDLDLDFMKISKTIDTKNLTDKDAEISLAIKNLYDVCEKYNVTMFARAVLNDKKYIGAYTLIDAPPEKQKRNCLFLLDLLAKFIKDASNGKAIVTIID